jgi:hypothetical protein
MGAAHDRGGRRPCFGYFAVDKFLLLKHEPDTKQAPAQPAQAITQVKVPEKSIAVLPFVDMSEKHDQEYFSSQD